MVKLNLTGAAGMQSLDRYLVEYAQSHRNAVNQAIHVVCVPLIYFSSLGLAWCVPVGHWLPGLPLAWQDGLNLATLSLIPQLLFYFRLSPGSALTGLLWMALSLAAILAIEYAQLPLLWICASVWIAAWIGQFYGHKVEGAKPSFAKDLVFLLIGPLFVSNKIMRMLGATASRPIQN
jgi:uncharacterized membrane protein YGL010W